MPRTRRVIGPGESYYHITTRVVDKIFRFTADENVRNVELLRRVEEFSCVQVLSYCFMSNHLHILLRVPVATPLTEDELLDRIQALYGNEYRKELVKRWRWAEAHYNEKLVEIEKAGYYKRMFNMGEFMKTLKQRLTMSYNARNDREGTLWESRYKSLLLEGMPKVLTTVAAYIELNPVRAGMVSDPAEYRFSSYGEACRGDEKARAGLCRLYQEGETPPPWKDVAPVYRTRLVMKALPSKKRAGMKLKDIQYALENCGTFSLEEIQSDRCRFYTTGYALGSTDYIRHTRQDLAQKARASTVVPGAPPIPKP